MRRALLDVNVLLALLDSDHADHAHAQQWAAEGLRGGWASCAVTENGFVRVLSQPRYPSPVPAAQAADLLAEAAAGGDHAFWNCDLSILSTEQIDLRRIHSGRHLTDAYLLALATRQDGRLVTFDRSIPASAVPAARAEHLLVL